MEDASADALVNLLVGLANQPLYWLQLILRLDQGVLEVINALESLPNSMHTHNQA